MGKYINPGNASFQQNINSEIYIDMSGLISFCNRHINTNQRYLCVSRPRRFGKSMAANMLTAYYGRNCDSASQFENLEIAKDSSYAENLNKYNTIHVNIQNFVSSSNGIENFLGKLQSFLIKDLTREYKDNTTAQDKYLDFLRNWLKDMDYVGLCYMTGILPIKKYVKALEDYHGNILLVGVSYDKKTKEHFCRIEKVER